MWRCLEIAPGPGAPVLRLANASSSFSSVILWSALSPPFKMQEEPTRYGIQVFIQVLTIRKRSLIGTASSDDELAQHLGMKDRHRRGATSGEDARLDVQTDFGAGFGGRGSTAPLQPGDG